MPGGDRNWTAIVDHLAITKPDLVIHAGDISLDGAHSREDLEHAKVQLDRLGAPWRAVPGNHDLGETDGCAGLERQEAVLVRRFHDSLDVEGGDFRVDVPEEEVSIAFPPFWKKMGLT